MNFYEFCLGLLMTCIFLFLGVGFIGSRYDTKNLEQENKKLKEQIQKLRRKNK